MQERARAVRSRYAEVEASEYGRSWTTEEIMLGCVGDVGDLAKLVQGKAGPDPAVRQPPYPPGKRWLSHRRTGRRHRLARHPHQQPPVDAVHP